MPITPEERNRLRELVARIYAGGYAEGAEQAAVRYGLQELVPAAATEIGKPLEARLRIVDKVLDRYVALIERKAAQLATAGLEGPALADGVGTYARNLADNKAGLISEMEFAQARLDGAGAIMDAGGIAHTWRFPHFDLGGEHEECAICTAIRERAPYTTEEAEAEGFPSYPHPNCDHGWVLVPQGELSKPEAFPVPETSPRFQGGERGIPPKLPRGFWEDIRRGEGRP